MSHQTELWAHQRRTVDAVLSHFDAGTRRVLGCGPTGCGKSRIMRTLAETFGLERTVCVVHTRPLLEQSRATVCPQVVTVQSMLADHGRAAIPDGTRLVLVDEAHHHVDEPDGKRPWGVVHRRAADVGAAVYGTTATPARGDNLPLRPYYDQLIKIADYSELIALGLLVPARIQSAGEWKGRRRRQDPIRALLSAASGLQTVAFFETVCEAERMAAELSRHGLPAECVTGETPDSSRRAAFGRFCARQSRVLCNVDVLTEGVDLPLIECVLLAARKRTLAGYLQAAGRGLRCFPGKEELLLIDLVGASDEHDSPDIDRDYSLDGAPIRAASKRPYTFCGTCLRRYVSYPTPGLGTPTRLDEELYARRKRWVAQRANAVFFRPGGDLVLERLDAGTRVLEKLTGQQILIGDSCPHCAAERPAGREPVQLVEVTSPRGSRLSPAAKAEIEQAKALCATRGHKPGWAVYFLAQRFGLRAPRFFIAKGRNAPCNVCGSGITLGEARTEDGAHALCAIGLQIGADSGRSRLEKAINGL